MMGEQWGRTGNMKHFTVEEWVARMDEDGVQAVCVPSLKQAFYRRRAMAVGHRARAHRAALRARAGPRLRPRRDRPDVRHEGRQAPRAGDHRVRLRGRPRRTRSASASRSTSSEWWPFYTKCAELDVPVVFQVGPLGRVHAERLRQADPARRHRDLVPRAEARRRPHRLAVDRGADLDGMEAPERLHRLLRPRAEVLGPEARALPELAQPRHRQGDVGDRLPADPPRREPRADRRSSTSSPRPCRRCCTTPRRRCSDQRAGADAPPATTADAANAEHRRRTGRSEGAWPRDLLVRVEDRDGLASR